MRHERVVTNDERDIGVMEKVTACRPVPHPRANEHLGGLVNGDAGVIRNRTNGVVPCLRISELR